MSGIMMMLKTLNLNVCDGLPVPTRPRPPAQGPRLPVPVRGPRQRRAASVNHHGDAFKFVCVCAVMIDT